MRRRVGLVEQLEEMIGLNFSKFDEQFLSKQFQKFCLGQQLLFNEDAIKQIQNDSKLKAQFVQSLQINYSQFFRQTNTYEYIEQRILFKLNQLKKDEIRIWSAACASGQEAFSMAILLKEFQEINKNPFRYRIFATDISNDILLKAKTGVFCKKDLENVRLKYLQKYFEQINEHEYRLSKSIIDMIDFSIFDLSDNRIGCPENSIYGDFDLIFCCNVLYYYNAHIRQKMINKLCNCLAQNGYIITDNTERHFFNKNNFIQLNPSLPIFQRNSE